MLIGYARVSKSDGSQSLDLQRDALRGAGVEDAAIYEDQASGSREDRPGLDACLKAARQGDVIIVWKLDRLGRNLRHLVNVVQDLQDRDVGLRVLAGQGASIDTTTASGKLVFAIFAAPGGVREGADSGAHRRGLDVGSSPRPEGGPSARAEQGSGAPGPGRDGGSRYQSQRAVPGARHHQGDSVPLRGA